jgi:hypothetical protein
MRMLNWVFGNIDGTYVVTVDGHGVLSESIVTQKFLHP